MSDRIRLVIDPGHGGDDPGATALNGTLRESDINLDICLVLEAIFKTHPEYAVMLTRRSDTSLPLRSRTDIANSLDSRLISVHCNAASNEGASGTEVWCFSDLAPVYDAETAPSESEGHKMAAAIAENVSQLGIVNRGAKQIYDRDKREYVYRKLHILVGSKHPAVLVECGFLSNTGDASKLDIDADGFNEQVAVALFKGIDSVLRKRA